MIALFAIIPFYLFIGAIVAGGPANVPELALDRMAAPTPAWSLVYLSLFLAALLPVFVLHQQELIRRALLGFIFMWLVAYICFLAYPTIGPRPASVAGDGFHVWTLKAIYSSDVRYNCFPSLHVAQCFLAAFAVHRVHRGVGTVAVLWAFLVGVSTVYTKQHYVLDVVGGIVLASTACAIFLRGYAREAIPENERRLAPILAAGAFATYGALVAILWLAYWIVGGRPV